MPEDVAVFDDTALAKLAPERATEVLAVRNALQLLSGSSDLLAAQALADIPRRSPLSDWRMLVRGLVQWYAEQYDQAAESWSRLDPQRRPGRIAASLQAAQQAVPEADQRDELKPSAALDAEQLAAAKHVRTVRFERPALEEASRQIGFATVPAQNAQGQETLVSPEQITGLIR